MKDLRSIFALAWVAFAPSAAFSDSIKPATLNLRCVENGSRTPMVVLVASNSLASAVVLNDKVYINRQLIAGTEGGPAYLQAVDNEGGYNVTISGGALVRAFDANATIENGSAPASISFSGRSMNATCTGLFSFGNRN